MMRAALLALLFALPAKAAYVVGPTISTTTGKASELIAGKFEVAKDSTTSSTPTITMDGAFGSVNLSSMTAKYGIKSTTAVFAGASSTWSVVASSGIQITGTGGLTAAFVRAQLTGSDLIAGSVDTTKLGSDSVTSVKILAGAIDTTKLAVAPNTASGLVQTTAANKYPALDGSLITGISGGVAGGTPGFNTFWSGAASLAVGPFIMTSSSMTAPNAAKVLMASGSTLTAASGSTTVGFTRVSSTTISADQSVLNGVLAFITGSSVTINNLSVGDYFRCDTNLHSYGSASVVMAYNWMVDGSATNLPQFQLYAQGAAVGSVSSGSNAMMFKATGTSHTVSLTGQANVGTYTLKCATYNCQIMCETLGQ